MTVENASAFVVGGDRSVYRLFNNRPDWSVVEQIQDADLIVLTGGEDINPHLYGQTPHKNTYFNASRDSYELTVIRLARENGIGMAGICRGAQMINVLAGGSLFQDVDNHASWGTHSVYCELTKETYDVTSIHHQMMRLTEQADLLLWGYEASYKEFMDKGIACRDFNELGTDPEAAFYPEWDSLLFQGHPEYDIAGDSSLLFFYYLHELMGLGLATDMHRED